MLNVEFILKIENNIIHEDFHCCVVPCFFAFLIWFSGAASKGKKKTHNKNETKVRVISFYKIDYPYLSII